MTMRDFLNLVEEAISIDRDTRVLLDNGHKTVLTLGKFFDANDFDLEQIDQIKTSLKKHGSYATRGWGVTLYFNDTGEL